MALSSRAILASLIAPLALIGLAACGGDDTWEGSVPQDTDAQIGDWKGRLASVTVECSGDPDGDVTMTLETPDGEFTATLPRPDADTGTVTVSGPGGRSVTWDETGTSSIPDAEPDVDDLPRWGADLTVTADGGELDEYGGGGSYRFSMEGGSLSCAKQG